VVWNNVEEDPPEQWFEGLGTLPARVEFLRQQHNSLNNRFRAHPHAETEALLLLDDDVWLPISDVIFALGVWQQFRERIVGFVPRKHVRVGNGALAYGGFELLPENAYSMVLTGAAFVRREYLAEYLSSLPASVHALVDRLQNCEDIAFNMMVSRLTGLPPIFVSTQRIRNVEQETESPFKGLWHRTSHALVRTHCLNALQAELGGLYLKYNTFKIVRTEDCVKER